MADVNDWNAAIIDEFRDNDGKVGGPFEGAPMLLLHHTGARSGTQRVSPLVYQAIGGCYAVFASKGGHPANPDWYHNLVANSDAEIEVGTDRVKVHARVADDAERGPIWEKQKHDRPTFAEYEAKTNRTIPVVILEPTD